MPSGLSVQGSQLKCLWAWAAKKKSSVGSRDCGKLESKHSVKNEGLGGQEDYVPDGIH